MTAESLPLGEHAAELKPLDGKQVRLVGTYVPVPTLKKMPRPGKPRAEAHLGEVVIELAGSAAAYDAAATAGTPARIALGDTVRPRDEIARLGNRRVSVEGRLALAPGGDDPQAAAPRPAPVLYNPTGLRLAE